MNQTLRDRLVELWRVTAEDTIADAIKEIDGLQLRYEAALNLVRDVQAYADTLHDALDEISEMDTVEAALDPEWAVRRALTAIQQADDEYTSR